MVVLRRGAFSHERGTPVGFEDSECAVYVDTLPRQSRPDSGLDFQVSLDTFKVVRISLGWGGASHPRCR